MQRLSILKKNHADEQYLARRNVRELPKTIDELTQRLANLTDDLATSTAHADDPMTIGQRIVNLADAKDILWRAAWTTCRRRSATRRRVPLGVYRGLHFGIVLDPYWSPEVYLQGEISRQDTLSRDHHGPQAVLNALDRLAGALRFRMRPGSGRTLRSRRASFATTRRASAHRSSMMRISRT